MRTFGFGQSARDLFHFLASNYEFICLNSLFFNEFSKNVVYRSSFFISILTKTIYFYFSDLIRHLKKRVEMTR